MITTSVLFNDQAFTNRPDSLRVIVAGGNRSAIEVLSRRIESLRSVVGKYIEVGMTDSYGETVAAIQDHSPHFVFVDIDGLTTDSCSLAEECGVLTNIVFFASKQRESSRAARALGGVDFICLASNNLNARLASILDLSA